MKYNRILSAIALSFVYMICSCQSPAQYSNAGQKEYERAISAARAGNRIEASRLLKKAVNKKYYKAQFLLALIYWNGRETSKRADKYFSLAKNNGCTGVTGFKEQIVLLSIVLINSKGRDISFRKIKISFLATYDPSRLISSTKSGDVTSQMLYSMYLERMGKYVKAFAWAELVRGLHSTYPLVGKLNFYGFRAGLVDKMSRSELKQARILSHEYMKKFSTKDYGFCKQGYYGHKLIKLVQSFRGPEEHF